MAEKPEPGKKSQGAAQASADAALAAASDAVAQMRDLSNEVTAAVSAGPQPAPMPNFQGALSTTPVHAIDLLGDVHLNVKIELGRTRMLVEDVLRLSEGAVVELDKLAGDPVDVYVNNRHVARGEVLVVNDNFCVRVNEVLAPAHDSSEKGAA